MKASSPKGWKTLGEKGEVACYQHLLLFLQCFQKTYTSRVIAWKAFKHDVQYLSIINLWCLSTVALPK